MPSYGTFLRTGTNVPGAPPGASNIFGSRVAPIAPISGPTLNQAYPNLTGTNAGLSSALMSELSGQLSPQTQASIADAAASFGVSSGMPGSGLVMNRFPRDIGLSTEGLIHQGNGDYSSAIPSVSATQTVNPYQTAGLNTEIGATNAINAAAPDPTAAATYAQDLFDKYLKQLSSPAGGTGGTGGQPWYTQGQFGAINESPPSSFGTGATSWGRYGGIPGVI